MLRIGSLPLKGPFLMAPMAGITDLPFRLLVRGLGAALATTEMVSAAGLVRGQRGTQAYLASSPDDTPFCAQIFGSAPDSMAEAAMLCAASGAAVVDINMGCPVRKVTRTGAGGALLRDLRQTSLLLESVRRRCPVPLTVKTRLGWSPREPIHMEIARICLGSGIDALIVHPRFVSEGFGGVAQWRFIAEIKEAVPICCIGNGDVGTPEAALSMLRTTGCDGVMIGRAAVVNPWIFRQAEALRNGLPVVAPTVRERRALLLDHLALLGRYRPCARAGALRGVFIRHTKALAGSARVREFLSRIHDPSRMLEAVEAFFDKTDGPLEPSTSPSGPCAGALPAAPAVPGDLTPSDLGGSSCA